MGKETEFTAFQGMSGIKSTKGWYLYKGDYRLNQEPYATEKEAMNAYNRLMDSTNVKVKYSKW